MADFSLEDLKTLRERLGTGMVDSKNALVEAGGDLEKATELLRLKGAKSNAKRSDRSTSEGLVAAKEGVGSTTIIELACETDFVARTEDFIALAKDLALHIAATSPRYLKAEDVPAEVIAESGETPEKYYEQYVLMAQPFVKDGSRTIEDNIKETVAKVRENLIVRRFVRYEIGG